MGRSLLIVDDHEGVAGALASMLGASGYDPVHVAHTGEAAITLCDRERPDLITVDLDLVDEDGLDLLRRLRRDHPGRPAVVLTATGTVDAAVASVRAGAAGFVPKSTSSEDLVRALNAAVEGDMWLPLPLIGPVVRLLLEPPPPNDWEALISTLSAREREVLQLMVRGLSRRDIAGALYISLNTVRTHVKAILAKLGVHASLEAVSVALRAGMRPDDPLPKAGGQPSGGQSSGGTTTVSSAPPRGL